MRSFEEQETPDRRRLWWIPVAALVVLSAVGWYATRPAPAPVPGPEAAVPETDLPTSGNETESSTERTPSATASRTPGPSRPTRPAAPDSEARAPATPTPAPREFRVTSDVPGAYVFLNRKFLGSTPLVSRDVAPGSYQLNVQVEGRPPYVQTVEVAADGPTELTVTLPAAASTAAATANLDVSVAVVHQHGVGSCEGTLRASGDGFRYVTSHKDAFTLPFAAVETFRVDYADKRLRLKQRGGRTWNFTTTAPNADPLFVFHRDVEAAR